MNKRIRVLAKNTPSLLLGRYGVGLAYRLVPKIEATWRDVRGFWVNTKWWQLWVTFE